MQFIPLQHNVRPRLGLRFIFLRDASGFTSVAQRKDSNDAWYLPGQKTFVTWISLSAHYTSWSALDPDYEQEPSSTWSHTITFDDDETNHDVSNTFSWGSLATHLGKLIGLGWFGKVTKVEVNNVGVKVWYHEKGRTWKM